MGEPIEKLKHAVIGSRHLRPDQKSVLHSDYAPQVRQLKTQGVSLENEIDAGDSGPASFTVVDPDGNSILFDQPV